VIFWIEMPALCGLYACFMWSNSPALFGENGQECKEKNISLVHEEYMHTFVKKLSLHA
jgi:hypothetical protein